MTRMPRSAPFTVAVEQDEAGPALVRLRGELDIAGDRELRRTLLALVADGRAVALELGVLPLAG
jgi:hypothetical protein